MVAKLPHKSGCFFLIIFRNMRHFFFLKKTQVLVNLWVCWTFKLYIHPLHLFYLLLGVKVSKHFWFFFFCNLNNTIYSVVRLSQSPINVGTDSRQRFYHSALAGVHLISMSLTDGKGKEKGDSGLCKSTASTHQRPKVLF